MSLSVIVNYLPAQALETKTIAGYALSPCEHSLAKPLDKYQTIWQLITGLSHQHVPIAAIYALADDLPAYKDYWMFADPVKFEVDLSQVYLAERLALDYQLERQYAVAINSLLVQDSLRLLIGQEHRWYIQSFNKLAIETTATKMLLGKSIADQLPRGPGGKFWQKLLTELQMLLKHFEVDDNPQHKVDSLWFWGAGRLPENCRSPFAHIFTSQQFSSALAKWCNLRYRPLNELKQIAFEKDQATLLELSNEAEFRHMADLFQTRAELLPQCQFYSADGQAFQAKKISFLKALFKRKQG